MTTLPSGEQYAIYSGDQAVVVTEQGATLRSFRVASRDVIRPFAENGLPQGSQGQHLLPWPNRIRDGRWVLGGVDQQLPVNELERHNAIHGLVSWLPWTLVEHGPTSVEQRLVIHPQPGWPGHVECRVRHSISRDGLAVDVRVTNLGAVTVPVGYAAHPYLVLDAPIDEWHVAAPADGYLAVDDRLLPVRLEPVDGTPADLRRGDTLGDRKLDTALKAPDDGWVATFMTATRRSAVWADAGLGWVQFYTPDDRASLAVEPMSCGPDAFNGSDAALGLAHLEPDATTAWRWGIIGR